MMSKIEQQIITAILRSGRYNAVTEARANKAWEVLNKVAPHQFRCVDRSDEKGAFFHSFEHTPR
jgi:hypothetical protein